MRSLLDAGFYVDGGRARDALRRRLQFNAIETRSAFKIDLIIRKERPFSRGELGRRQPAELAHAAAAGGPSSGAPLRSPPGAVGGADWLARGKQGHLEVDQTLEDGAGTMCGDVALI